MKVEFSKQFEKQIDALKNPKQKKAIAEVVNLLLTVGKISEVPNVKKMKGHKSAYRIRVGDFRMGVFFTNPDQVFVATFLHRKEIYKKFP
ncbi:MAG: type II toxin-antitoxin system RelE family toxin [Flavobacteriales bacterium]